MFFPEPGVSENVEAENPPGLLFSPEVAQEMQPFITIVTQT